MDMKSILAFAKFAKQSCKSESIAAIFVKYIVYFYKFCKYKDTIQYQPQNSLRIRLLLQEADPLEGNTAH